MKAEIAAAESVLIIGPQFKGTMASNVSGSSLGSGQHRFARMEAAHTLNLRATGGAEGSIVDLQFAALTRELNDGFALWFVGGPA